MKSFSTNLRALTSDVEPSVGVFDVVEPTGMPDPVELSVDLPDVIISSYQAGGHSDSSSPIEQFSLNFAKVESNDDCDTDSFEFIRRGDGGTGPNADSFPAETVIFTYEEVRPEDDVVVDGKILTAENYDSAVSSLDDFLFG